MATNRCSSGVFHACTQLKHRSWQSQPQPLNFGSTLLVCFCTRYYKFSLSRATTIRHTGKKDYMRRTVTTFATNQSTMPPPDKAEETGGALSTNREAFPDGEYFAGTENGATKAQLNTEKYRSRQATEYVPMGLSPERKYEILSVKDYLDRSRDFLGQNGGPPRWFCPLECSNPPKDAPVLFFLPGIDGTGQALILHHQILAELFEVRCLHIPASDRTPFEGLVKYVEEAIKLENKVLPMKPIYLVGDSFGGCLALAVAACNPTIDLVLVLANPATSVNKSQLQPLFPLMEAIPEQFHGTLPYFLTFVMGDPVRMAMANVKDELPLLDTVQELSNNLGALLPQLQILAAIIPKDALLWKLKLLQSAALYTGSRLHSVKAEVLMLASGKDQMLPTREEARRLKKKLSNYRVRYFNDSGHTLLLEDGINLATLIKSTHLYRRSRNRDHVLDYVPPTPQEFKEVYERRSGWFLRATSPVLFSTLEDGKIVKGLGGIPQHGPVLLVGNHLLMGLDVYPVVGEFLRERNILVRGIAHPNLFSKKSEEVLDITSQLDTIRLFGAVPVSAKNFYRLLSTKSFVLLYPGGVREALHRKGEQYQLFWPERAEFVRMAARFQTTIIPFAAVGEDDLAELVLDYNDLKKLPYVSDWIKQQNQDVQNIRSDMPGEISEQELHFPGLAPKIPGRLYYLFGKPIATTGREKELKDKEKSHALYLHIKDEVEAAMSYLQEKRKEDPYRQILQRVLHEAMWEFDREGPSFEP